MLECLNCNTIVLSKENRCVICNDVLYPINPSTTITNIMGEGNTPMFNNQHLTDMIGCKSLKIKNEGVNPTGSFKDRGSALEIKTAKDRGFKEVVLASTGNMGASVAAYCGFFGLKCTVFVPLETSKDKLNQIEMYGGWVSGVNGDYNDCMLMAESYSRDNNVFLAGDYYLRMSGMMSLGKEILLDNNSMPDYIFVPVGNGNLLYSIYLSLKQFTNFKMPKIVGVQIAFYDNIRKAFYGDGIIKPITFKYNTIATAVNISDPLQGKGVLKALKDTDGLMSFVTDQELLWIQKTLATNGLFLEPSGALAFAGAHNLQYLLKNKNVVIIGTGHGLKGV